MINTMVKVLAVAAFFLVAASQSSEAAKRCKSSAYDQSTAEEFCEAKLKCADKTPPEELLCRGKTRDWKCWCVKPKPKGGNQGETGGGKPAPSE
jgi:hypothetical protein